jgi:hexosaminidase
MYPEGEAIAFEDDGWCGFRGDDFVISIDLGKETVINSIKLGFLQNQPNWIFLPARVEYYTSLNGEDYINKTLDLSNGQKKSADVMKVLVSTKYTELTTRYIMIKAKNSLIPDWHDGAGKPAWIFVDEVIVN